LRILIIEDEVRLAEAVAEILRKHNYTVECVYDGLNGLDSALTGVYDLIILDIMLPKLDGYAILKSLRNEKLQTPVLLLTAKDETSDKVKGLDSGADDYLTKPFETEELLARIRALVRRPGDYIFEEGIVFGDLRLNISDMTLVCGKKSIALAKKEFDLMRLLMLRKGTTIPKEEIIEKIWGYDAFSEYNNVEVYVSFLRKKMSYIGSFSAIKTIRSAGYRLHTDESVTEGSDV
jgi:DNA-binding response OmpR family regulator